MVDKHDDERDLNVVDNLNIIDNSQRGLDFPWRGASVDHLAEFFDRLPATVLLLCDHCYPAEDYVDHQQLGACVFIHLELSPARH